MSEIDPLTRLRHILDAARKAAQMGITVAALLNQVSSAEGVHEVSWDERYAKVERLNEEGSYADGLKLAEELLRISEHTFGPQDPHTAAS